MLLGYNTNGLPHHRTEDALRLIAETGYRSVALTVDHHCLDPFVPGWQSEAECVRELLDELDLRCVVETGARFLLDPRVKHEPTLVSSNAEDRAVRVEFLKQCIDIAAILNADAVSFWSGILRDDVSRDVAMQRLADGCRLVIDHAATRDIPLAFEPEPGMFVERFSDFEELLDGIGVVTTHHSPVTTNEEKQKAESGKRRPEVEGRGSENLTLNSQLSTLNPPLGLTIDIGHVHCVEDGPIADHLRQWAHLLFNVHIEDMVRGVHEHLRFGDGEIDFPPVLAALQEIGYTGGVHVELSRHGHLGPEVMEESLRFLSEILDSFPPP